MICPDCGDVMVLCEVTEGYSRDHWHCNDCENEVDLVDDGYELDDEDSDTLYEDETAVNLFDLDDEN